jgi:rod shape-determining protein MreD
LSVVDLLSLNFSRFWASLLPVGSAILLTILVNLPVSLTGGLFPAPILALPAIYFWALVRPDLMSPFAVLVIGVLEDLLSGGAPGLWAAGFLSAYALADRHRDILAGLSGAIALFGFAAAMLLASATAYILTWIVYLRWPALAPLLLANVVTVMFYPLIALPLGWLHRRVVGAMRGEA